MSTVAMYVTGARISATQQRDASEAIGGVTPSSGMYVERGYQPPDSTRILLLILGALGAVLMLGGTITTTFLALSDARPDLATSGGGGGVAPGARSPGPTPSWSPWSVASWVRSSASSRASP
ncbi:MAG: hypothetical protein R2731_11070 [Nocardioides sp.]